MALMRALVNAPGAQEGAGHVRGLCFSQGADGSIIEGQQCILALLVLSASSKAQAQIIPCTSGALRTLYCTKALVYLSMSYLRLSCLTGAVIFSGEGGHPGKVLPMRLCHLLMITAR